MSIYFGNFQPHKLTNTQLYIQRKDSTVSLCTDYSTNGYDLTQGVAANQPTLATTTIDFATNDFMSRTVANAFLSDTTGSVFISGVVNTLGLNQGVLTSGDTSSATRFIYFGIGIANRLLFQINNGGTATALLGSTVLTAGDYYSCEFRQDGTAIRMFLNGVEETVTASSGSNSGSFWWNTPTSRDNLVIGALIRSSTTFTFPKINKIYGVSGSLSALDRWKIEQFMSNPLNYI